MEVAYDINPKWIAQMFDVSEDKAQQAVELLYESEYFHEHMCDAIEEALTIVGE